MRSCYAKTYDERLNARKPVDVVSGLVMRWAFSMSFSALIAVGVLRPALPELMRAHWVSLIVVLALAAAVSRSLRARARRDYQGYLVAILPLVLAVLYLQPQRVASDGIFYYAPLHSVIVDGDLDFENEYRVLGALPGYFQRTATGRLPNNYSVGPALVWAPFFLVAHALGYLGLYRPTGFGYPYFTAIATGTALVGFLGVVWTFQLTKTYVRPATAFAAAVLVWLASFHVWYMVFEPSMSHAMAMASVALFLLVNHRGVRGAKAFALMGVLGAVVALLRWQNILFLPAAIALSWARHGRPKWQELALGAAAFVIVFSPQLMYWNALYGSPLLVPQGGGYIDWASPELEAVLFSSRHGLLSWAPLLWLGILGFPGFIRRAPVLGVSMVLAIGAAWYVNASVYDWWAGASFGSRRFDAALPALCVAVAVSLEWIVARVRQRPLATVFVLLAPFVIWNAMLMGVYFSGAIAPDAPASFRQAAADGIELFYSRFGYPPSWPASIPAEYPPSVYDLVGSQSLANNVDIRMGDTDALFLGPGWSLPTRGRQTTTRSVSGPRAEIFVALVEPAAYELVIEGPPSGRGALVLNGVPLGEVALDTAGQFTLGVSPARVRSGVNQLSFIPKGPDSWVISRVQWRRSGEP
jgi:hypothetical protein